METLIPQMVTLPGAQESDTIHVMAATHTTVDRHKHSFYELVFVREGYCLHHLADSVSLAMEGDILLIKPGVAHRYAGTRECKIFNCLFLQEAFFLLTFTYCRSESNLRLMLHSFSERST